MTSILQVLLILGLVFCLLLFLGCLPKMAKWIANWASRRPVVREVLGVLAMVILLPVCVFGGWLFGICLGGGAWILTRLVMDSSGFTPTLEGNAQALYLLGHFLLGGGVVGSAGGVVLWCCEVWRAVTPSPPLPETKPSWAWLPRYSLIVEFPPQILNAAEDHDWLVQRLGELGFVKISLSPIDVSFIEVQRTELLGMPKKRRSRATCPLPLEPRTKVSVFADDRLFDTGELWEFAHRLKKVFLPENFLPSEVSQPERPPHDKDFGIAQANHV